MSTEEIKKTYGLSSDQAYKAKQKGFFVKNYMKKQIVIDRLLRNGVYPNFQTMQPPRYPLG